MSHHIAFLSYGRPKCPLHPSCYTSLTRVIDRDRKLCRAKIENVEIRRLYIGNSKRLKSSTFRNMFINIDLTYIIKGENYFDGEKKPGSLILYSFRISKYYFFKQLGSIGLQSTSYFSFGDDRFNLKIGLCNLNELFNKISLLSTFLFKQTLHIFGVAETWILPSITDYFNDISDYSIVCKVTSSQVAKHGVCKFIYIRRDIKFVFIMVYCENVIFVLG